MLSTGAAGTKRMLPKLSCCKALRGRSCHTRRARDCLGFPRTDCKRVHHVGSLETSASSPLSHSLQSEVSSPAPLPPRARSAHPPSVATSSMLTLCSWAMYPRMEKMANPEMKLVTQLMVLVSRASLGGKNSC